MSARRVIERPRAQTGPRDVDRSRPRLSVRRITTGGLLAVWAATFWWLLLTHRSSLYLSNRTAWVIPLGAVLMTIAAIGRLASARTAHPEPARGRDLGAVALLLVPVVVLTASPVTSLGSFAVDRRASFASAFVSSSEDIATGDLSLADVAGATRVPELMNALVGRAGSEVSFVGFVDRDADMPADEFMLTRFMISCCVADALTVQVRVTSAPPGEFQPDDWVRVTGALYPVEREVIVDATEVEAVPRPENPYLNP
jgi:putative membrane protein